MRILLAEDDSFLGSGILMALKNSGYSVDLVSNGADAEVAAALDVYDLLILDLGLPKVDGLTILKTLRQRGSSLPVLIITARDAVSDRVLGLDLGANDYLVKPFDLLELEARIRALLRKSQWSNKTVLSLGPIEFDTNSKICTISGAPLELSARELSILEILLSRHGTIVNKAEITKRLSDWEAEVSFNAVDIAMHRLRKRLEPNGITIKTFRNLGYLLEQSC